MEDLLQSQIKKSCDLAVPNGLKELMWDISREVLRVQPQDINNFITKYLSVLLVTRENLTVAAKVCDEACHAPCQKALKDALREIGLDEENVETAENIIMEHLQGPVKESDLLSKLLRKTNILDSMLPAVQEAIRSAFVQRYVHQNMFEPSSANEDAVGQSVRHTLELYQNMGPTDEEYNRMATRIQEPEKKPSLRNNRLSVTTESSTSLAGSYVKLPRFTPYSAHDFHFKEEALEKVHSHKYLKYPNYEQEQIRSYDGITKEGKKKISFDDFVIKDDIPVADDESEGSIEEVFPEDDNDNGSEISEVVDEMSHILCDIEEMDCSINENIVSSVETDETIDLDVI